ncbi:MAG TPA: aminotransferase class III-fold pyridoxal phosphate-dependent enzyme [Nitrospirae bacterium]|nr:aminotransferase class III-fold pyridoxal phosphate-dependent enzyme [Nitrospirota bacterium]
MELKLDKSYKLKETASKLIPSITQTFSKGPRCFVQGASPVYISRGSGCHIWDVDDNEYIDFTGGLGPVLLGYCNETINSAIIEQLGSGIIFTLPHPLEIELARELSEIIPCAEMVRFGKNGSDATSGSVRLARAYTKREKIACCGYHGWQDWFIGTTTRSSGIPECVKKLTLPFEYNNIESLKKIFNENPGEIAAVIMEPVGVVEPENNFLQNVKELAEANGTLLIFDEIVTGFRVSMGGAQEHYGVIPDLACFGKGMANGMPISAIVGKRGIMELFDEVFFSFTFAGEALSLAASVAMIRFIKENNVISDLWEKGKKMKDGINGLAHEAGFEKYCECIGLPPRTVMSFKSWNDTDALIIKSFFQQECMKRGILFTDSHNISYAHTGADIQKTLEVYKEVLSLTIKALNNGDIEKKLKGPPVKPVFRKA